MCQLWNQQAALNQDCCNIMVTIGLMPLDTNKLVPVVPSVLAAVQYWMQSANRGVPSWSWGMWRSFSRQLVLIHSALTVCWGCQNAQNQRPGKRRWRKGNQGWKLHPRLLKNRTWRTWKIKATEGCMFYYLCLQCKWIVENMRSRQPDRVSNTVMKILFTWTLLAIL